MTIIERIQNLAKKATGQDISGETIQEALESFEKAVNKTPQKNKPYTEKQEQPKRRSYSASKFGDDD